MLHQTVQAELETFLARAHARERPVPRFVERELRAVRQWVLSLPFGLRYRLAYDAPLASAVLGLFPRAAFAALCRHSTATPKTSAPSSIARRGASELGSIPRER